MAWRVSWRPLLLLIALAVLVRLPFFFPAVIDHDESTFILIGQSWLDGWLPYTQLWDVKPPLLFGVFAGILALVGDSVPGIRLAGALCVGVTAWIVYDIVRRNWTTGAAALSATLSVVLSSVLASGQATMSEHVMLPFLMGAVSLYLRPVRFSGAVFALGGLLAAATLIRPNIALTLMTVVGLLAIRQSPRRDLSDAALCVAGAGLVTLAVCLPFVWGGHGNDLWNAAVVAAGVRADITHDVPTRVWALLQNAVLSQAVPLWVMAGVSVVRAWVTPRAGQARDVVRHVTVILASVMVGILVSGGDYQHYWIQAVPLAALLVAPFVDGGTRQSSLWARALVLLAVLLSLPPIAREYRVMAARLAAGESLSHGPAYELATFLRLENPDRRPVLLLVDHLAYWLTDTVPPSPFAAHPSTLGRARVLAVAGTSASQELSAIFARAPLFVVMGDDDVIEDVAAQALLREWLARDYVLQPPVAGRRVYRRVEPPVTADRR